LEPSFSNVVPLDTVIATADLVQRRRGPDYEAENRALVSLASILASSPDAILQKLVDVALELCDAHSAGLSLIEEDKGRLVFRWPAITGRFAEHVFGGTPRDFSPCGVVVDTNAVQLFDRPGRHYTYLDEVAPRIVEALLQPFSVSGRPIGTIWLLAHDTERKFDLEDARALKSLAMFASNAFQVLSAVRAAKEEERRKDEFLALLSHEMRNPLHAALTWSSLMKDPHIGPEKREHGEAAIGRSLAHLTRMVDDLSDVSKIGAQKLSIELSELDLSDVVRSAVDDVSLSASEAHIDIDVVVEERLFVRADSVRIEQVIGNLLSNALKFTPRGGKISIQARRIDGSAEIVVSDTGEGMSAAMLPSIFERFQQGDATIARRHGGLGLGLAIAKHLVELHGGTIEAHSDGPGRGSTFRVILSCISS
jgi:signal transduction histidine kinase